MCNSRIVSSSNISHIFSHSGKEHLYSSESFCYIFHVLLKPLLTMPFRKLCNKGGCEEMIQAEIVRVERPHHFLPKEGTRCSASAKGSLPPLGSKIVRETCRLTRLLKNAV